MRVNRERSLINGDKITPRDNSKESKKSTGANYRIHRSFIAG